MTGSISYFLTLFSFLFFFGSTSAIAFQEKEDAHGMFYGLFVAYLFFSVITMIVGSFLGYRKLIIRLIGNLALVVLSVFFILGNLIGTFSFAKSTILVLVVTVLFSFVATFFAIRDYRKFRKSIG